MGVALNNLKASSISHTKPGVMIWYSGDLVKNGAGQGGEMISHDAISPDHSIAL